MVPGKLLLLEEPLYLCLENQGKIQMWKKAEKLIYNFFFLNFIY